jgi:hypothetical protein
VALRGALDLERFAPFPLRQPAVVGETARMQKAPPATAEWRASRARESSNGFGGFSPLYLSISNFGVL